MTDNGHAPVAQSAEHRVRNPETIVRHDAGAPDPQLSSERKAEMAREMLRKIITVREEILTAFIAKYGVEDPAEIEQVTMTDTATGNTVWFVRRRQA